MLEQRRRRAVGLLRQGKKAADVAAEIGTTVRSVRRWLRAYRQNGDKGLRAKPVPGRPRKLSASQERRLLKLLRQGPGANGWPCTRWGAEMISYVIARQFHVSVHPNYVNRLLARSGTTVRGLNESLVWRKR